MKKKILFVIPKICNGGAERRTVFIANCLAEKGYNVELLSFWDTDGEYPLHKRIKRLHLWKCLRYNHHAQDKFRIINLFFILFFNRPKLIITMHPPVALMIKIAGFLNNFNLIDLLEVSPSSIKDISRRCKGWDRANKIFVQCKKQKDLMPEKYREKCVVINNPVPDLFTKVNHQYNEKILNFINVGRLDIEKNQELLINAFALVVKKHNDAKLTIYGRGPLKEKLSNLIIKNNLSKNIFLIERSDEMEKTYNNYDGFILSSNFEGMPNSLLEAMAVGLPSISTDCDTGPSDIINSRNGILVKTNNVHEMAKAISFYIENPSLAKKYGIQGKKDIQANFSQSYIIEQYIKEIDNLL